jgi:hypothetical protein
MASRTKFYSLSYKYLSVIVIKLKAEANSLTIIISFLYTLRNYCLRKSTYFSKACYQTPILEASRSKAWVCGLSIAGIVGSNPAGDIDVCI